MYFRRRGYHYYEEFTDYIKLLPLAPHRCRSAPRQLPLTTAVCTPGKRLGVTEIGLFLQSFQNHLVNADNYWGSVEVFRKIISK